MASTTFVPIFVLSLVLNSAFACFVTNCPPGGKRSVPNFSSSISKRQCMSCGPDGKGRCFSPNICCGDFGCILSPMMTSECQRENFFRSPCKNEGLPCGTNGKGVCATDGFCCDEGGCSSDVKCTNLSSMNAPDFI